MSELPQIGKYQTRRVLGQGAMGTVYEAWDPDIERPVAIKTIRKDVVDAEAAQQYMARFRNEARAAGRLHHPNIVGVYEFGEQGALAYIAMEFVHGMNLHEHVSVKASFGFGELVALLSQLLDALSLAHSRGIVHRDIKPANLIVTRDAVLKVADFGVARIDRSSLTMAGMLIGTPSYMSPEQCMGLDADPRSDLFSTGVVLYELLAGRKPFTGAVEAITYKICHDDPPPPSTVSGHKLPPAVDQLVLKALAKQPDERFPNAQAFKEALQEIARMPVDAAGGDDDATRISIGTMSLQVPTMEWDDATLDTAEHELARVVGPMAKILVRKAAARTRDRTELCALLADNIADPALRERFRRTLNEGTGVARAGGTTPPRSRDTGAPTASGHGTTAAAARTLDQAYIDRVTARLAAHLGPIARIVTKQIAARAYSREEFTRLCAAELEGDARAQFTAALRDDG